MIPGIVPAGMTPGMIPDAAPVGMTPGTVHGTARAGMIPGIVPVGALSIPEGMYITGMFHGDPGTRPSPSFPGVPAQGEGLIASHILAEAVPAHPITIPEEAAHIPNRRRLAEVRFPAAVPAAATEGIIPARQAILATGVHTRHRAARQVTTVHKAVLHIAPRAVAVTVHHTEEAPSAVAAVHPAAVAAVTEAVMAAVVEEDKNTGT